MWKLIVFFGWFGLSSAFSDNKLTIVNGTDAEEGEFKFAVSIREVGQHNCGGTIINRRHILTAAHCVCNNTGIPRNPNWYAIQYGSIYISNNNERVVSVSTITCNKFKYSTTLTNDIAVLKLSHDIPNDGTWEPVKLSENFNSSSDRKGEIIGWGRTSDLGPGSQVLKKLEVSIYSDTLCSEKFDRQQHFCVGAKLGGACNGDSGTALLTLDKQQIGISSFLTNKCGIANRLSPNIYAKVEHFYKWIQENSKIEQD